MGRPRERFPRTSRLRRSREFQRASRVGQRMTTDHFIVLLARDPGRSTPKPRLGVTVSRRVGGAVARNRVKRGIREWFRRRQELLSPALDVVVIARHGAATLDATAIWRELNGVLS